MDYTRFTFPPARRLLYGPCSCYFLVIILFFTRKKYERLFILLMPP